MFVCRYEVYITARCHIHHPIDETGFNSSLCWDVITEVYWDGEKSWQKDTVPWKYTDNTRRAHTTTHTLASDIKRDEAPHTHTRPPTPLPLYAVLYSCIIFCPPTLLQPSTKKKTCAQNKSQPFPTHSRWSTFLLLRFRKLIFIWLILLASLPVTRFWDYFRREEHKRTNDGNCCQSL